MTARVLCIAGTNTDIGKTIASAAIVASARAAGARVVYVKPAQTGLQPGEDGSDTDEVKRLVGAVAGQVDTGERAVDAGAAELETHEFVRLPDPLAPAAAARVAGASIPTVADHAGQVAALARRGDIDLLVVEGAGGLLVQLDTEGGTQADLMRALIDDGLEASVVVVADPALGTLNLCALTQEALDARGLPCDGYVFGTWPVDGEDAPLVLTQNVLDLPAVTGRPLLGRIPRGAGRLEPEEFVRRAGDWVTLPGLMPPRGPRAGA